MESETLTLASARLILSAAGPVTPEQLRAAHYLELIDSPTQRRAFAGVDALFIAGAILLSGWLLGAWLFGYAALYIWNFQRNARTIHAARLYAAPDLSAASVAEVNHAHAHTVVSMSLILGVSALLLSLAPAPLVHCIAVGYGVVLVALWVQAALMRRRAALVVKQASSQPWYAGFQSAEDQRQRNIADITSADLGPAPADFDLPSDPFGSDLP